MGNLISFIIFGIVIFNIIKKAGLAQNTQKKPNIQEPRTQQRTQQRAHQQNPYYYGQQQKATKDRLQQKYGKQEKTDILSRAKENVKENEQDKIAQDLHAEVCDEYRGHVKETPDLQVHKSHAHEGNVEETSDIIKRINDLMITGYSGDMHFERDFVAEGVEMLNRFGAS